MRVGFLTHYSALYGANRSLLNVIDGLRVYGVEPYVVAPDEGDLVSELRARNVPFAVIPLQWWVSSYRWPREAVKRFFRNTRLFPALARQLQAWEIQAVYTNSAVIPSGAFAAKLLRLPHIWHLREFVDLDYGFHYDWGRKAFSMILGWADAKIAISEPVRAHLLGSQAQDAVHVVYNGIAWEADFDRLHEYARRNSNEEHPYTFALLGMIHPSKGQNSALQSMALLKDRFPQARLLIVGSGAKVHDEECRRLAADLGLDEQVEFWGYIKDPYRAYQAADAVLMCSRHEALGRTTIEAMSACRPVVGYDRAGTSELIEH
ncbi:MAG: glycosyltransferase, partial [Candidatus Binatia bacterium]